MPPRIARASTPQQICSEYIQGKQTLAQLAEKYGVSVSTIQRRLREVHSTRIISKYKEVVVLMDTTYRGHGFGVVMMVDAYRKRLLWRKFIDRKEVIADYLEGIEWLRDNGFKIHGIVCDGLRGLAQALCRYRVQYCQFHQVMSADHYLTRNPITQAGKELRTIAHLLCHTDRESFAGALDEWYAAWGEWLKQKSIDKTTGKKVYTHKRVRSAYFSLKRNMKWLWTFYDGEKMVLPNTNNIIEAINGDLKNKLRAHPGLSKQHRKIFIDEYFRLKYNL